MLPDLARDVEFRWRYVILKFLRGNLFPMNLIAGHFYLFMPSSETLDCYFENGLCGWTGENDWKIESTVNNGIEK